MTSIGRGRGPRVRSGAAGGPAGSGLSTSARTLRRAAPVLLLLLPACVSVPPPPAPTPASRQADRLKELLRQEEEIARFAGGLPGLAGAQVKLRDRVALLFLVPAGEGTIPTGTVDRLNRFIKERTGLEKEAIVLKVRRAARDEQ